MYLTFRSGVWKGLVCGIPVPRSKPPEPRRDPPHLAGKDPNAGPSAGLQDPRVSAQRCRQSPAPAPIPLPPYGTHACGAAPVTKGTTPHPGESDREGVELPPNKFGGEFYSARAPPRQGVGLSDNDDDRPRRARGRG